MTQDASLGTAIETSTAPAGHGRLARGAQALGILVALAACDPFQAGYPDARDWNSGGSGGAGGVVVPPGRAVGETCGAGVGPCRRGLSCNVETSHCEPGHSTPSGEACVISAECAPELQCLAGACLAAGAGKDGEACATDADCAAGLRCSLAGLALRCGPEGTHDVGALCAGAADCFSGLTCIESACAPVLPGTPPFLGKPWEGVACAPSEPVGSVRAFFEVPGAKTPAGREGDYFRFPFPNDFLRRSGHVDVTGFPTPGAGMLGFDPVAPYLGAVSGQTGFGTSPTVVFRFSGAVDFDTLRGTGGDRPVHWIDLTSGTLGYGREQGFHWVYSGAGGKTLCRDWFALRPGLGGRLEGGHTYAAWIERAPVKDSGGNALHRSEHMDLMLAADAPASGDAALVAAHQAFAPFRQYLATASLPADDVLVATVFTTEEPRAALSELATAVGTLPAPAVSGWVRCAPGVTSPCPDAAGERACGEGTADYDEFHALVALPSFQSGEAPYLTSGGAMAASPVRTEQVCLALTVPKVASPASGFPLVVYAHGTGGSMRSHVSDTVAGALARAATPDGTPVPFAVLGIDEVEHGPRRGSSTESPDVLFFNFTNPAAARGNSLQGAVDQLSLDRLARELTVPAEATGGAPITLDPTRVAFWGHSQGASHGALALPFATTFRAAVLSGSGASLLHALLEKTKPTNIAAALPFVLGDADAKGALAGGEFHPTLALLQQWLDPADPLHFAGALSTAAPFGPPKSFFVVYGQSDSYSPPSTLRAFLKAGSFRAVTADVSVTTPDELGAEEPVPFSGNANVGTTKVTRATRQYAPPSGRDGHFVAFDVPSANADIVRFLATAVTGSTPPVVGAN